MPKIAYTPPTMRGTNKKVVDQANTIIAEYAAQGYSLTLRQVYYQFVSRDWIKNTLKDYKRLGEVINQGRLQGLIDWDAIEDRTRNLSSLLCFDDPAQRIKFSAEAYRIHMWARQTTNVEIWIVKEALAGVIERTANRWRVPFLSCRGYTSQSEMWSAGMRLKDRVMDEDKDIVVLHLGDHDPSGIDMSRDIQDRLELFMGEAYDRFKFVRVALNMDQVEEFAPPPNPAKVTDSRFESYQNEYGDDSWELDALNPATLDSLVTREIKKVVDMKKWREDESREEEERSLLVKCSDRWDDVVELLEREEDDE